MHSVIAAERRPEASVDAGLTGGLDWPRAEKFTLHVFVALLFGLAGTFGMHIVPMQGQVLALFATLLSSSFLTPSFIQKYETCFVQSQVSKLPFIFCIDLKLALSGTE